MLEEIRLMNNQTMYALEIMDCAKSLLRTNPLVYKNEIFKLLDDVKHEVLSIQKIMECDGGN